jgi:hypothetical protein
LTVTVAGAAVTSTEFGVKLNAVRVGGVVSVTEVTVSVVKVGNLLEMSAGPRSNVFPTASVMKTVVTVQAPASLNLGKVAVAVLLNGPIVAGKVAEAVWV